MQRHYSLLALLTQPHQSVVGLSHSQWDSILEPLQFVKAQNLWALLSSHQSPLALFHLLLPLYGRQSARLEQQATGITTSTADDQVAVWNKFCMMVLQVNIGSNSV